MQLLLLLLLFLEQFLDGAYAGFLCKNITCNNCECFFRAPFHTLRTIRLLLAQVAGVNRFGFGVQHHCAIVAGFNTPAATIALVLVNHDCTRFLRLRQRVSGACCDASWLLAEATSHSHVHHLVLPNRAYAALDRIESFLFGPTASVLADLAADAFVWVASDEFSLMHFDHALGLLLCCNDAVEFFHT